MKKAELQRRQRRLTRVRSKTKAFSRKLQRHRVVVHRSLRHMSLVVVDWRGRVVLSMTTSGKELRGKLKYGGNIEAAKLLGVTAAKKILDQGIRQIIFDRGLYRYHGRVAALADALRAEGIEF